MSQLHKKFTDCVGPENPLGPQIQPIALLDIQI